MLPLGPSRTTFLAFTAMKWIVIQVWPPPLEDYIPGQIKECQTVPPCLCKEYAIPISGMLCGAI